MCVYVCTGLSVCPSVWLLICSLVLQKQIFLGNQTALSLELVVTAIVSHIVMLCVCKWTVSGGFVLTALWLMYRNGRATDTPLL